MQRYISQFQQQIMVKMRQKFGDLILLPKQSLPLSQHSLFILKHAPSFTIDDVTQVLQNVREPLSWQLNSPIHKIYNFVANLLTVLENNEKCRLNWEEGIVRGRVQRQTKVNLSLVQNEKAMLLRLNDQCRYGVTCKSQLVTFITYRKDEIFGPVHSSDLTKNIRQLYLLEHQESYALTTIISEQTYLQQLDHIIQKLLSYHNSLKYYIQRRISFQDLQQKLVSILRQDFSSITGSKVSQLIKYTLSVHKHHLNRIKKFVQTVHNLRRSLIKEIVKAYYLGFLIKEDIDHLQNTLLKTESILLNSIHTQKPNKLLEQSGVKKVKANNNQSAYKIGSTNRSISDIFSPQTMKEITLKIESIQRKFNIIFSFITGQSQAIFIKFYQRKLNKRMVRLSKIQDKLTHLYKLFSNSQYIQQISLKQQQKIQLNKRNEAIQQKIKELKTLKGQLNSLNQSNFRLLFEEIQRVLLFVNQQQCSSQWNEILADFEEELFHEFAFNSKGQRIWKEKSWVSKLSKSNLSPNLVNYNISKEDVFQQSILQIINKSQSLHSSRVQNQDSFDKYSAAKQGTNYLLDLRADFGQHLLDQDNFKVHFLPKLIRKLQKAYEMTPYSEQPLNLQLASMLQNLKLIPYIVVTQINQKKLNLLVYPKFNLSLLYQLKKMLTDHQQTIVKVFSQINNNPIRRKAIDLKITGFLEFRLKFLFAFLGQVSKLDSIIKSVDQSQVIKQSYDISEESTYNIVLKYLLVQKEVKAYIEQNKDKINKQSDITALKLVNELYDYITKSCRFLFQKDQNSLQTDFLSALLQLCQQARATIIGNDQYMEQILRYYQDIQAKQGSIDIHEVSHNFNQNLEQIKVIIEKIVMKVKKYRNIVAELLKRQHIRVQQFSIVLKEGSQTRKEVFDQNSLRLIKILRTFGF